MSISSIFSRIISGITGVKPSTSNGIKQINAVIFKFTDLIEELNLGIRNGGEAIINNNVKISFLEKQNNNIDTAVKKAVTVKTNLERLLSE